MIPPHGFLASFGKMANSGPILVFDFVVVDGKVGWCLAKDEGMLHFPLVVPVDPAVWTSRYVKHAVYVLSLVQAFNAMNLGTKNTS